MRKGKRIRILTDEKGVALVMVLVLALIALAIVSSLVFMLTSQTKLSGAMRFYRTAEDASVGVADLSAEYIAARGVSPPLNAAYVLGCNCGEAEVYTDNVDIDKGTATCRCNKICNPTAQYNAGLLGAELALCNTGGAAWMDPTDNPDGPSRSLGNFNVFYKIIDTVEGNTDLGRIAAAGELAGGGVVVSTAGFIKPPHYPYMFRVEVEAQAADNPRERARMSYLYAF